MPIVNLEYPKFRALDGSGDPLSLGKVEIFLAGTSTQAVTYTDAVRTAQNTNPVILSSGGEAEIWFDVAVDVEIQDSSDVLQDKILGLAANLSPTVTGNLNLVLNGSFETDDDGDTVPDNWTVSEEANAVIAIDSIIQAHGHNSLKFDGAGSGGGTATSTKFDALTGGDVAIQFTYKSSNAATTNSVQINWYDKDDAKVGATITVHTEAAANPVTFTTYNYVETVPATAIQGELILTGVSSGGGQLSEDTWFDDIKIIDASPVVTLTATQTLTNKTLTSPIINGDVSGSVIVAEAVIDTSAIASADFTSIPSWVKEIKILIDQVSSTSPINLLMTIGDSGGLETSGYLSNSSSNLARYGSTTEFTLGGGSSVPATNTMSGIVNLINITGDVWVMAAILSDAAGGGLLYSSSGTKTLSGTLDRLSVFNIAGTLDNGQINIHYK